MGECDPLDAVRLALQKDGGASSDFDLNPDVVLPEGRKLRPASVLVPLIDTNAGLEVILTKRSSALKHHPGQVAFPGGKVDPQDNGPVEAALREANEEIALLPENVEIIGELPPHETVTGFLMTPVVGRVKAQFTPRLSPDEVAEVFTVPFSYLAEASNYQVQSRRWRGTRRSYFVVPYGPYYVWGATARVLRGLAGRMSA